MSDDTRKDPSIGAAATAATPLVSVGMPIYNAERWVGETVSCILAQTLADFELIVSDNASTDRGPQIVESLAARDSRIRLIRQPANIGANGNYDFVLRRARAPYFKWASSNDICAPQFLEKCVAALEHDPDAVLACPRTVVFSTSPDDGRLYDRDFALLQGDPVDRFMAFFDHMYLNNAMNGVFRREPLTQLMRLGQFRSADLLLMAEAALSGKFLLVDEPLFFRRMSPEAATTQRSLEESDRHLVPAARAPLAWQQWRYLARLLRIAIQVPPGLRARWRAGVFSFHHANTLREQLWADLWTSLKSI